MKKHIHEAKTLKSITVLGIPLLFGQITQYLHQIADSAMLGHFGEGSLELAAVGIAGLFIWVLNTFIWPFSSGVQAITSRRFGRQDIGESRSRAHTGEALDNGIVVALYAALLAFVLSFIARPTLSFLLKDDGIIDLCMDYIRILRWALVPLAFFVVIQGFFSAINKTSYVMYSGLLSNSLNILLNWVFIYGKLGFPAMGIRGAALGTLLATTLSTGFLLTILFFKGYTGKYRLFSFKHLSLRMQKDIFNVALPPGIQNIIALSIFMVYQTMIESYSPVYLAATHSVFSYMRLNKTIIGSFARSASILIGNALGKDDREGAQKVAACSAWVGLLIAASIAIFSFIFKASIAVLFTNDPGTQKAIMEAVGFFCLFFMIEAAGYTFEMIFTANGYGNWVLFSEAFSNLVFILGATLLARTFFPDRIYLAWLSFGLYQLTHAGLLSIGYFRKKWIDVQVERPVG